MTFVLHHPQSYRVCYSTTLFLPCVPSPGCLRDLCSILLGRPLHSSACLHGHEDVQLLHSLVCCGAAICLPASGAVLAIFSLFTKKPAQERMSVPINALMCVMLLGLHASTNTRMRESTRVHTHEHMPTYTRHKDKGDIRNIHICTHAHTKHTPQSPCTHSAHAHRHFTHRYIHRYVSSDLRKDR